MVICIDCDRAHHGHLPEVGYAYRYHQNNNLLEKVHIPRVPILGMNIAKMGRGCPFYPCTLNHNI